MKYAVIAAGEGSRLAHEGVAVCKPLVRIGGECLADRLVRLFMAQGAAEVFVVCRRSMPAVAAHLQQLQAEGLPVRFIAKDTPSSMHSLYELVPLLGSDEPVCVTTVDTVFRAAEFAAYVRRAEQLLASGEADGLMGVTEYIDDEKPLYVTTGDSLRITAFLDSAACPRYVSAGVYALAPSAFDTLARCVARGDSRMRNFQRALLADGLRLQAWPFSKVIDIDHASDIAKAETLIA